MSLYLKEAYSTRNVATPQSEPIPGREPEMVANSAGGYAFPLDDFGRLDRFLILGSEGNTYYSTERKLTQENAKCVGRCIQADGLRTVARIVEISDSGRAPKNDPALYALAMCAASTHLETRRAALRALPRVARISTHLFHFAAYVEGFRGWGRALRNAVAAWYEQRPVNDLALQVIKYRQRDGWTHRDMLRLSHPESFSDEQRALYDWVCGRKPEIFPELCMAFDAIQGAVAKESVDAIRTYKLPREAVPTELLNDVGVWEALLDEPMPMTAMIRNLGKMSQVGLLKPLSAASTKVCARLLDEQALHRARVHPIALLMALKTYATGHGEKGKLVWTPAGNVVDALDKAFYLAFKNVQPTGKRILLALDVSGSMGAGSIAGTSLTPREGAAAMAMVIANTESNYHIIGFTGAGGGSYWGGRMNASVSPLNISPRQRLDDVVKYTASLPFGSTDCALPMIYAQQNKLEVDAFIVITDNETWAGNIHPVQALQAYRNTSGIPAKSVVIGMTATGFSIADPNDAGMLDICGFDSAAPQVIADFIRN